MFIECTIRRKLGSRSVIDGQAYHFMPIASGEHVAEVVDEAHAARFLSIPGYREFTQGQVEFVPLPQDPAPVAPALVGTQVATPNVADMDRDALMAYAESIGMRKPHPAIGTDKLRANVAAFLDLRATVDSDEPVSEDEPKE